MNNEYSMDEISMLLGHKVNKITYKLGIGRAEYTCPTPQSRDAIVDFLQSMNRQGEIGFWEKQEAK